MSEIVKSAARKLEAKQKIAAFPTHKPEHVQSLDSPVDRALHLQCTIGNQVMQRLARSGAIQLLEEELTKAAPEKPVAN
jgi:hypothetical protein